MHLTWLYNPESLHSLMRQLAPRYDGTWLQCPLYVLTRAEEFRNNCFFKLKGDNYICYWPTLGVMPRDALESFDRIFAVSASTIQNWNKQGLNQFSTREMNKDIILDPRKLSELSGSAFKNLRTQVNAFERSGGSVRLMTSQDRPKVQETFYRWREYWKKIHNGPRDQISSTTYTLESLRYDFLNSEQCKFVVCLNSANEIVGFNIHWFYAKYSVSLVRVHDYTVPGAEAALLRYTAKQLPQEVLEWNDGCGDGDDGTLTKHKRFFRPIEERTYYTVLSKIASSKNREFTSDALGLF